MVVPDVDPAHHKSLMLIFALMIVGVGVKAAVVPLHGWLPKAMVAPAPVSALLHAVAVVKAGVFTLLKVTIYIFGGDFILSNDVTGGLIWIAAATILIASMVCARPMVRGTQFLSSSVHWA